MAHHPTCPQQLGGMLAGLAAWRQDKRIQHGRNLRRQWHGVEHGCHIVRPVRRHTGMVRRWKGEIRKEKGERRLAKLDEY